MKDYYQILGLSRSASAADIRDAYRRLVKKFHPDVNRDAQDWAAEHMKAISEAYAVLSDPAKRRAYDQAGRVKPFPAPQPGNGSPFDVLIGFVVGAAAPYVPAEQLREVLNRKVEELGLGGNPPTLVDLAEQSGFLRKKRARGKKSA